MEVSMDAAKVLIVDDEFILRQSLQSWLERDGYSVDAVASGEECLDFVNQSRYDILFLDIKLEGMSGMEVLGRVREIDPDVAVIMITAYGSIATAVEAMKQGAHDYLLKPFEPEGLSVLIEKIMQAKAQARENLYLRQQHKDRTRFESLIGQSEAMQAIFDFIQEVAPTESIVLIGGETGTGKELAAKAIHTHSHRCNGPFVAVNCGSLPEHLMESELFGHQQGAFTDAKNTKKGRFELAQGGTLLLDEVGEVSQRMQIDLLRVLEERRFYRVGGTQPIDLDCRIIAATNTNLEEAVRQGSFREDLYYRLNVIPLTMPPLRTRKEDIPLLAEHFRQRFVQETNKPIDQISRSAMDELMLYEWPGNVRELENAIERAVVIGKQRSIQPDDLPIFSLEECRISSSSLRDVEREHIAKVLKENDWNIQKSARLLGIDRSTLYSKIKRYRISKES
jgi:DNA-binding NtrC family response regulator